MKKSDLKKVIKPLVKECIHEVLLEEGLLSNVVSEVAKGLSSNVVTETKRTAPAAQKQPTKAQMIAQRKKLMDSISSDAYNGVDLFEGTEAFTAYEASTSGPSKGGPDLGDPRDAGVDISSIMGASSKIWQAMK